MEPCKRCGKPIVYNSDLILPSTIRNYDRAVEIYGTEPLCASCVEVIIDYGN